MRDLAREFTAVLCRHLEFHRRHERCAAKALGMLPSDVRCLREFRDRGRLSIGELRQRVGLTQSRLSHVLGRLEAADLILRTIDPANHRQILAEITATGGDVVMVFDARLTDIYRSALERTCPEWQERGVEALRLLLACLPSLPEERPRGRLARPPSPVRGLP
ncbi:MAG: MarR family winged helix-turn-helix transcriptional regulator [Vicinamibacterales bacterium]